MDEVFKRKDNIVFHDKCDNAVRLAGNIRYFDFVFNE